MRAFCYFVLIFQLLFIVIMHAQIRDPERVNQEQLLQLARQFQESYEKGLQQAVQQAISKGWPIRTALPDASVIELQALAGNGMPIYYKTLNLNAVKTVSANRIWPGGSSNLNLTGKAMIVGEWDGGGVNLSHQEFSGRVTQMDTPKEILDHSTQVAGTLIATGIDTNAIGMAYQAKAHAYDWENDSVEMSLAASTGLLFSNHSYGLITGWSRDYRKDGKWAWFGDPEIDQNEDYNFGFYSHYAKDWDTIAYSAPYYLIVISAGNDREDVGPNFAAGESYWRWDKHTENWLLDTTPRKPDGIYDCISHKALAKNVLSVGAVADVPGGYHQPSDVVMSLFSSWGPTDDGRIKPDLVGNGIELKSPTATGSASYSSYSGTSAAAPNVCGSLVLLQQHYQNLHDGKSMRVATLKALVLHTADEAGDADGPDYRYGWGLLNITKAADVISHEKAAHLIREENLVNGSNYSLTVDAKASEPLIVTICWTDPPGTPPAPSLDPVTKMLVNDLDLRVIDSNQTFYPWILDPMQPDEPATTGDNISDNVEQVIVAAPKEAAYQIRVSHKQSLKNDLQRFSLIVSGIKPLNIPVELASFSGSKTQSGIELVWQTASESNNYGFQIERKIITGMSWESIGFTPGHGTSAEAHFYRFVDPAPAAFASASLQYRLKQIDNDGAFEYSDVLTITNSMPVAFSLEQNYPNPISRSQETSDRVTTQIAYEIPTTSRVNLSLYNVLGQKVSEWVNGEKESGRYILLYDVTALPVGIYFYTLQAGSFIQTKKLIILR